MQQNDAFDPALQQRPPRSRPRYRSLFWAIVLIGVGAVWLLFNLDVIKPNQLAMFTYVWPILLVGIGVDLLVGRRSLAVGALVGVVTVGLIIILMVLGPSLGWIEDSDLQTQTCSTAVGGATSADVSLKTGGYSTKVSALPASSAADRPLLRAQVSYRGVLHFESSGDAAKAIILEAPDRSWWWQLLDVQAPAPWEIGLDPQVPLRLKVDSASGSNELDLSGLRLTDLTVDISSGNAHAILPSLAGQDYAASFGMSSGDIDVEAPGGAHVDMRVDMSSGDARVALGKDSDVTLRFEGSSGQFRLELAAGQALRVEVEDVSSGDVKLPTGLIQVEQGDDEEGIWETQGYAQASRKVLLVIERMSSGDAKVGFGGS
jgi:hypothetical protein